MEQEKGFTERAFAVADELRGLRSESTCANYVTALRAFAVFLDGSDVLVENMDGALLLGFEHWLRRRGVGLNTISCYMRSLRSLYRRLSTQDGVQEQEREVFSAVFTGCARTRKRALRAEEVNMLRRVLPREGSQLELALDVFLFSLYAMGMPFVDVAHLRGENIDGHYIVYSRRKTGQRVCVPLEGRIGDIVDKYWRQGTGYLFPILEVEGVKKDYDKQLCNYNRLLKRLGRVAGLNVTLTSYVARHTWATLAWEQGVGVNVISRALGHTNVVTTQIYMRELDESRVREATLAVLKALERNPNGTMRMGNGKWGMENWRRENWEMEDRVSYFHWE